MVTERPQPNNRPPPERLQCRSRRDTTESGPHKSATQPGPVRFGEFKLMTIHVELFGIPRQRAGVKECDIAASDLGELLKQLAERYPSLIGQGLNPQGTLQPGYLANLNGRTFVTEPTTPLTDGDSVLILSADAGG